jgi:hypothetical protein
MKMGIIETGITRTQEIRSRVTNIQETRVTSIQETKVLR